MITTRLTNKAETPLRGQCWPLGQVGAGQLYVRGREGVSEAVTLALKPGVWGGLQGQRAECPVTRAGSAHVPVPAVGDAGQPSAAGRRDPINFAGGKHAGGQTESP